MPRATFFSASIAKAFVYGNGKDLPPSKKEIHKMGSPLHEGNSLPEHVQILTDGIDVWEIDFQLLKFGNKVASGSYGDLYRGTYHSQDVAIKVLKPERVNIDMQREFAQEVFIMRVHGDSKGITSLWRRAKFVAMVKLHLAPPSYLIRRHNSISMQHSELKLQRSNLKQSQVSAYGVDSRSLWQSRRFR